MVAQNEKLDHNGATARSRGGSVAAAITLPNTDQSRNYTLDGLGNWKTGAFTPVGGNSTTGQRNHNYVNQITQVIENPPGALTAFEYDGHATPTTGNGNLTNDGTLIYAYDTATNPANRPRSTALGVVVAWCLAAGTGTAMAAPQIAKAAPAQAVHGQEDRICGLPRAVFDLPKNQITSAQGVLIGDAFGEPVYVDAPKSKLQKGEIKYFAPGRRAFAIRCLEVLYGKYVQRYAPLRLFKGKNAFRKLDTVCRYTRWLGGGLTVPGMRLGTAYDVKVFIPLVIRWYRDHPAASGIGWTPPAPSPQELHFGAPADWAAERDQRLMGHSRSLIRALRAEYPSIAAAEMALWLDETQPPEVAKFCSQGFAVLRGVEAARHILRTRPDLARRIPKLAEPAALLTGNGQHRRLVRAVTRLAVGARAVVYLAILQDVRSGRTTLRSGSTRRGLVAAVAARLPRWAKAAVTAPPARGMGSSRQVAGHAWVAVWWILATVASVVLLVAAGISIAVRTMDAAPAAEASLAGSADRAVAYATSATGALCMTIGGGIFGFSLVAVASPENYWVRAGAIAVAAGLLFAGFTWATINLPVREKSLARVEARVEALASEIASVDGTVVPKPPR